MGNVFMLRFSRVPGFCLYVWLLSDSLLCHLPTPVSVFPFHSFSNRPSPSWSMGIPTPGWGGQIILLCDSNCVQWQIITVVLFTNFLDAFPKSQVHLQVFTQETRVRRAQLSLEWAIRASWPVEGALKPGLYSVPGSYSPAGAKNPP